MRVLFLHQNFPGQWRHVAQALAKMPGNEVVALTMNACPVIEGIRVVRHWAETAPARGHPYLSEYETQLRRAESAANAARALRHDGFVPDIICVHPGWGEGLLLKTVFPNARMLCYQEFFYTLSGSDLDFDPEFPNGGEDQMRHLVVRNSVFAQSLAYADWNVSPTYWQRSQFPIGARERISVIHEGVDMDVAKPDAEAWVAIGDPPVRLTRDDEVITFVNRNLEPYRGFHTFMRCLPELLRRRPKARIVIVGGDDVSYGQRLPAGQTYRKRYLADLPKDTDLSRVSFVGRIPYSVYVNLLQVSSVHVYLTYPFVLSWSVLEALSVGAPLVASATAPVLEALTDGETGLLVDFFSPQQIVTAVERLLEDTALAATLSAGGRALIRDRYSLKDICLPRYIDLVQQVAQHGHPN